MLDRNRLRALAGLGGEGFARELLETFLTESAGDVTRLRLVATLEDLARFMRIAHGVRITSQQIGAEALAQALIELEDRARNLTMEDFLVTPGKPYRGVEKIMQALQEVDDELERLRLDANSWLSERVAEPVGTQN